MASFSTEMQFPSFFQQRNVSPNRSLWGIGKWSAKGWPMKRPLTVSTFSLRVSLNYWNDVPRCANFWRVAFRWLLLMSSRILMTSSGGLLRHWLQSRVYFVSLTRTSVYSTTETTLIQEGSTIFARKIDPQVFDLGGENYRSPRGGILSFADAVLNNVTLPNVDDVKEFRCWPKMFEATVHAGVIWTFSLLRKKGIKDPCIAVLARSNPLVAKVSGTLSVENEYKSSTLRPVDHSVVWDAELSAAAGTVVASILEWSDISADTPVANTLEAVAHYYELKNATSPSNVATNNIRKFRDAAAKVRRDATPRINAAKEIIAAYEGGLELIGDPVRDWRMARKLLDDISHLRELYREARMVRLFRATDAIGSGLADLWLQSGHYGGAGVLVSNTLEYERLISADQEPRGCVLMSMHKSKGKEFDGVVIVEEKFSGVFFDKKREQPPFERTRRLLRVAITRARTHVTIVRPKDTLPLTQ